ncbi:MAG: cysteine--tRNA ligase [Candidatus Azambacteria bacterium]|nr:cysteine--tRNA ligase [Candidatus Azambacteria bacterium]
MSTTILRGKMTLMLTVYNSRTRKKEAFKPRNGKKVNMFVCGITPYNSAHIGNLKTYLNYDIIARYLRARGYKVFYLQNVTDVDDKIVNAAKEANIHWKEIPDRYFTEFQAVCKKLHITGVSKYAYATDFIPAIIKQVTRLIKKGYAYEKNGSVYFEVKRFKDYGKLSGQNLAKLHKSTRLEIDENKKHPYDFVLWKARTEANEKYEPSWKSPWGKGRPGWHIEDTAISEHFFGPQYDLHGGAGELKFPHHEAEIAQQESASGKKPFVKYWVHTGVVTVNGAKMSKSLGNFITGKEMIDQHDPDAFRLLVASRHYRSPLPYSEKLLTQAIHNLETIRNFARQLKQIKARTGSLFTITLYRKQFFASMDDDFNTPSAFATLFTLMRKANTLIRQEKLSVKSAKEILVFLKEVERIFGIPFVMRKEASTPKEVTAIAMQREQFRKEGKWTDADTARDAIRQKGYEVRDTKGGFEIIPLSK